MAKLTKEDFTQAVISHFDILPEDFNKVTAGVEGLYRDGFSLEDAIAYVNCWEEIDPFLNEDIAIDRMVKIRKGYE